MPALDATEAGRAAGHRHAETGDDRLGLGQVDLILIMESDRDVVERRATLRALGRQRDLHGAIDLLGRRRWPMTGRVTGLAAGSLGVLRGWPLGEGCGLTLAGPP